MLFLVYFANKPSVLRAACTPPAAQAQIQTGERGGFRLRLLIVHITIHIFGLLPFNLKLLET